MYKACFDMAVRETMLWIFTENSGNSVPAFGHISQAEGNK
jgi:hypothetical protein